MELLVGLIFLLLVLWVAYKLGKFVLRIVLGLALMALIAVVVWQFWGERGGDAPSVTQMKNHIEEIYQKWTSSPAGKELAEAMRSFHQEAKRIGREKLAEFKEKQLPAIKEKARKYKEELDRQGKLKEAQEFWDRFTRWLENPELPAPPPP